METATQVENYEGWWRIGSVGKPAVHLARGTDSPGTTICGYHRDHPFEEVSDVCQPGEPWRIPGATVCADCAAIAS